MQQQRHKRASSSPLKVQAEDGQGVAVGIKDDHGNRVQRMYVDPRVEVQQRQTGGGGAPSTV
eukprot:180994-Hanusia_phi.AAC.4